MSTDKCVFFFEKVGFFMSIYERFAKNNETMRKFPKVYENLLNSPLVKLA